MLKIFIKPNGEYEATIGSSDTYPILRGVEIIFNNQEDETALINNLFSALQTQFPEGYASNKKLLYINLSFGNKVFFGFEN